AHSLRQALASLHVPQGLRDRLREAAGPEIDESLNSPATSDPYSTVPAAPHLPSAAPSAGGAPGWGRYSKLHHHADGGMARIYFARDNELSREVALKEIKEQYADDPSSRRRFVHEAEVTGHLEHPGIVPIYGLGSYPDGRPYYAMRFIKGE